MFCNNNIKNSIRVTRIFHNYRMSLRLLHFVSYNQLHTFHFFFSCSLYFFVSIRVKYIVQLFRHCFACPLTRTRDREKKKKVVANILFLTFRLLHLIFCSIHLPDCFDTLHQNVYLSHIKNTNPKMRFNFLFFFGGRVYPRYENVHAKQNAFNRKCSRCYCYCCFKQTDFVFRLHAYHPIKS